MACGQACQSRASLQLRELGFGFLQDGDVEVGVFPEGEEISVRAPGPRLHLRLRLVSGNKNQGHFTASAYTSCVPMSRVSITE